MLDRPDRLRAFLEQLHAILVKQQLEKTPAQLVNSAFDLLGQSLGEAGEKPARRLPICNDWLEPALELGGNGSAPRRHLLNIFRALEPRLHWHRRSGSLSAGRTFYEGHANAMLIGPGGLEVRDDVWLGLTLMAPQVNYMRHQHPPEELYLAMTCGEWQQGDGPWFARGPGETVHNQSMIHNAIRSGETPLFTFWLLRP